MSLKRFLLDADAACAERTLMKLRSHDIAPLALTGGFAIELHLLQRGSSAQIRPLNDIDFLVDSFDDIPRTMSSDFIFRHVHPHDPPAKTLLQCVDPDTSVRVDIFRAYRDEMKRAQTMGGVAGEMRMVALEDLTARNARLCLDLAVGTPMPAKHAQDFLRLLPLADAGIIEEIWQEHRKPAHPATFAEAAALLAELIPHRPDLQTVIQYSQDVQQRCGRCKATEEFPLADAEQVLALLGYC